MTTKHLLLVLALLGGTNNLYALSVPSAAYYLCGGVVATCVSAYLTCVARKNQLVAEKKFADVQNQLNSMDIVVEKFTTFGLNTAKTTFYLKPLDPELRYNFEQCDLIRECSQQLVTHSYEIHNQANYCAFAGMATVISGMISCFLTSDLLYDLKKI